MSEAPKRIWAEPEYSGHTQDCGEWDRFDSDNPNATQYIRADLHAELMRAADELAERAQSGFDWIEMIEGKGNSAVSVNLRSALAAYNKAKEHLK